MSPVVSTFSIVSFAIYLAKVEINYKVQITGLAFRAFMPWLAGARFVFFHLAFRHTSHSCPFELFSTKLAAIFVGLGGRVP